MVIHNHIPGRAQLDAQIGQPQPVDQGPPARCGHHQAGFHDFTVTELHPVMGIFSVNGFNRDAILQDDTLLAHFVFREPADITIKPSQEQIAAIQQRGLNTQPGQNAGKLNGNVTTAPDDCLFWQLRQVEHLVGGKNALFTGYVRNHRPAAGGHGNVFRRI